MAVVSAVPALLSCSPPDEVPAPSDFGVPRYELSAVPLLRIGAGPDADDDHQLFRIAGAYLTDGGIVVANGGTAEVRYYDRAGTHVRSVGGRGGGPGEFRLIRSMSRASDGRIAVWDPPRRRITLLADSGGVLRTVELRPTSLPAVVDGTQVPAFPFAVWSLGDGTMLVSPGFPTQVVTRGRNGVRRDTTALFLYDQEGRLIREVGPFPGGETYVYDRSSMPFPFGHRLLLTAGRESFYIGTGKSPIYILDGDGAVTDSIVVSDELRGVTPRQLEAQKAHILAMMPPAARQNMAEMLASMPEPETVPAYSRLLVDAEDRLWVKAFSADPRSEHEWKVYGPDAAEPGLLVVAAGREIMDAAGDTVLVVSRDDFDVEVLSLHRMTEPEG